MRTRTFGVALALALASAAPAAPDEHPCSGSVPKDLDDALSRLQQCVTADVQAKLRSGEVSLAQLHFGLGLFVRNAWIHRGGALGIHLESLGLRHPDDMSAVVLESFVRKLQGKPLQVEDQVKKCQEYWQRLGSQPHGMGLQMDPCPAGPPRPHAAGARQAPGPALTIAEIWARRDSLKGTRVTVRGKAKTFREDILCRNWIHLRDGTGTPGKDDDLTVATNDRVEAGDDVVATGTLRVDRDFGAGFFYPVVLEDADVTR